MKNLLKKNGVFYLQLRRGGRLFCISTGATRERDAQEKADEIVALFDRERRTRTLAGKLCKYATALARREITEESMESPLAALEAQARLEAMDVIERLFPARGLSASELWEKYLATSPKLKPKALEGKKSRFGMFAKWAADMDMRALDGISAQAFLNTLDVSDQTWNNYCFDIGSVFKEAGLDNPFKGLNKNNVSHKERTPMDFETAKRIFAYCDAHPGELVMNTTLAEFSKFMRLLYYTGLRPSDIATLLADEYVNGRIELLPDKTSRTRNKVSFILDPNAKAILDSIQPGKDGHFFPDLAALEVNNSSYISIMFTRLRKRAGVAKEGGATLYGFRHLYATWQLQNGSDKNDVAAAIGHSDTKTTNEFYYHGKTGVKLQEMPAI